MQITPVVNNAQSSFSQTMTSNGGTLYIQFAGSGWRGAAGKISVDLLMDGAVIATASVYTNEASSHKALVPVAIVIPAAAGQHTFTVAPTPGSGTNIDQNDYFTVTVNETAPNHFEKGKAYVGLPGLAGMGPHERYRMAGVARAHHIRQIVQLATGSHGGAFYGRHRERR